MFLWPDINHSTAENIQCIHFQCTILLEKRDVKNTAKSSENEKRPDCWCVNYFGSEPDLQDCRVCFLFHLARWLMLPLASNCLELITVIMYKQILSECICKSFNGTLFRGTHGKEDALISNSAIVEVLLTLTDNSNYFSECAFWSVPNVSWQIIKKTSGLFDTATKYKGVFLATLKGFQLCSGEIPAKNGVRLLPVPRKSWINTVMDWWAVEISVH